MTKHRAAHRATRPRRRRRVLATALGATIVAGAVAVLPQLKAPATADTRLSSTALVAAALAPVQRPVAETAAPVTDAVATTETAARVPDPAVPSGTGAGRRIVFDQSDQRVWLVGDDGSVERTYPVSGSRFDNLQPGSYAVQSRTLHATAFDASGTMDHFVRFATGYSEPIGFHSVPRDNAGRLEQTKAQLGTPLSAGCVRQWMPDAVALWDFAPVGTKVVVTA